MSRVGAAQMRKLLDLLSEDGVLVNGKVSYVDTNKCIFWKGIASKLNAVEGGVYKTAWKWCKMWADWKTKTKRKANILLRRQNYGMEYPTSSLTDLELRLLKLVDYPLENKDEEVQLVTGVTKTEPPELPYEMHVEYVKDEYNDVLTKKEREERIPFDVDNNTVGDCYNTIMETRFCDVVELSNGGDTEKREKMKERVFKRKKSLRNHRLNIELTLEKQRTEQKTEELRLKAIELKLKREELRLKELEINKISHITNIEEEKLKCFNEISASLKELVERFKNGNTRF